jgi:hypothetical protein
MTETTDATAEATNVPPSRSSVVVDAPPNGRRGGQTPMPRLGVWSWSFVGFVAAAVIASASPERLALRRSINAF